MLGVDYSYDHPTVAELKAAGVTFVFRYISSDPANDGNGKNLLPAETQALLAAGIAIGVVVEEHKQRMKEGRAKGVADAQHADQTVTALGMAGIPVYFAADWDVSSTEQAAVNAYLDGAASVIGLNRVGIYGGINPLKGALDAGKATYAWQTYAWSAGQWEPRANVRQVQNSVALGSGTVDKDESQQTDFGQWPRPSRYVADGTLSLAEWAAGHGTTADRIIAASRANLNAANLAAFEKYLANHMPEGLVFWTA
jgi:glycoside hydrolase-like protein